MNDSGLNYPWGGIAATLQPELFDHQIPLYLVFLAVFGVLGLALVLVQWYVFTHSNWLVFAIPDDAPEFQVGHFCRRGAAQRCADRDNRDYNGVVRFEVRHRDSLPVTESTDTEELT